MRNREEMNTENFLFVGTGSCKKTKKINMNCVTPSNLCIEIPQSANSTASMIRGKISILK